MLIKSFVFGTQPSVENGILVNTVKKYSPNDGWGFISKSGKVRFNDRLYPSPSLRGIMAGYGTVKFRFDLPTTITVARLLIYCGDSKGVERSTNISIGNRRLATNLISEKNKFNVVDLCLSVDKGFIELDFTTDKESWVVNTIEIYESEDEYPVRCSMIIPLSDRWNQKRVYAGKDIRSDLDNWLLNDFESENPTKPLETKLQYLLSIEKNVDYFLKHLNISGAIVDQDKLVEFQYSTPCFAFCAALVAKNLNRIDLWQPALLAFDKAAHDLANRTAATNHEDFYPTFLAHAYPILSTHFGQSELTASVNSLCQMDPFRIYRKPPGGRGGSGSNWNCKSASGEYLLYKLGIRKDLAFVDYSIAAQGWMFTSELGLYMEGPTTYDLFPRAWLSDMMEQGYIGAHSNMLSEELDRGAITSLFLQASDGSVAPSARSSYHVWSDALQCVIFEIYAKKYLKMNSINKASVFKQAAKNALDCVLNWQRVGGDYHIIKNRYEPKDYFGYEPYSSNSQYNLLTAAILGIAYDNTTEVSDKLKGSLTPAEVGMSAINIPSPVDITVLNSHGSQLVYVKKELHKQNAKGINRLLFKGACNELALAGNFIYDPLFNIPDGKRLNLSMGLVFGTSKQDIQNPENLISIANSKDDDVEDITINTQVEGSLTVKHKLNLDSQLKFITEQYRLTSNQLNITYNWEANESIKALGVVIPILVSNGQNQVTLINNEFGISAIFGEEKIEFLSSSALSYRFLDASYYSRNGEYRLAFIELEPQINDCSVEIMHKSN
ncbi:MAG: hypothetical protein ABJH28_18505 [Paraglaciecola sp.]|uniref:hypothetical protein n=1 Tax=Paraglaciecola sp. TaxID=1920173 RepID=UPI003266A109